MLIVYQEYLICYAFLEITVWRKKKRQIDSIVGRKVPGYVEIVA